MAKKGQNRHLLLLVCSKCGRKNYISEKNKMNTTEKLEVKKYCKWCRAHLSHKENTRLK